MNKKALIKKINELAQQDKERRLDPRYLKVMGFLVAKGFLYINKKIPLNPNEHINLKDAIWAGRFVEARILEVLPAAYERFKKHFSGDANTIEKLEKIKMFFDLPKGLGQNPFYLIHPEEFKDTG